MVSFGWTRFACGWQAVGQREAVSMSKEGGLEEGDMEMEMSDETDAGTENVGKIRVAWFLEES